ncbi:MAG: NADH dehydrogenase [Elusimicrobia bacterium RIFOXYB2_FULL_49_7]|nr:MAG: NADH dehydrogenase [Elusimicrobia bacterium RIFOXYB2_FULL_49_7]
MIFDTSEILRKFPNPKRDSLIPILQLIQERQGYLSKTALITVGRLLKIPVSKVFGVASFYNQFRFNAPGRFHIQICRGTACHVKGSFSVLNAFRRELGIEPGQTTRDGLFSLEILACIGACGLAPVICINGEFHTGMTPDKTSKLISTLQKNAGKEETVCN